jgi:FtsZ-binding cell division protein ZapB
MGTDLDQYVHPDRISSQLICPICTQVLKNPVQTSTDHLFCEDELLEWMSRSSICPVSKQVLDPSKIKKPSRIILNMLAELEIYCTNKNEGCNWSGQHERLENHLVTCTYRPRSVLQAEIQALNERIIELQSALEQSEERNDMLAMENTVLKGLVEDYQQRLRVFHALLPSENRPQFAFEGDESFVEESEYFGEDSKDSPLSPERSMDRTDAERLRTIRALRSLQESKQSKTDMKTEKGRK